ncbi:hypothetical protein [Rhodococcus pyridinivorans]|uniref:hypothetical protein n=1 Tax=Rhodococcus pyridinivorans TaxID=103816 RepID=UPI003AAAE0A4
MIRIDVDSLKLDEYLATIEGSRTYDDITVDNGHTLMTSLWRALCELGDADVFTIRDREGDHGNLDISIISEYGSTDDDTGGEIVRVVAVLGRRFPHMAGRRMSTAISVGQLTSPWELCQDQCGGRDFARAVAHGIADLATRAVDDARSILSYNPSNISA